MAKRTKAHAVTATDAKDLAKIINKIRALANATADKASLLKSCHTLLTRINPSFKLICACRNGGLYPNKKGTKLLCSYCRAVYSFPHITCIEEGGELEDRTARGYEGDAATLVAFVEGGDKWNESW